MFVAFHYNRIIKLPRLLRKQSLLVADLLLLLFEADFKIELWEFLEHLLDLIPTRRLPTPIKLIDDPSHHSRIDMVMHTADFAIGRSLMLLASR